MAQILAEQTKDTLGVTGYDHFGGNLGQRDGI